MSRLSLKPGGEPGLWEVSTQDSRGRILTLHAVEVTDDDLLEIQRTLAEYFAAKEPVAEKPKGRPLFKFNIALWKIVAGVAAISLATSSFWIWIIFSSIHPAPPSTGGVIDSLCMRPDIECSTEIRYMHPQKSGIVEQEYYTFPKISEEQ